MLGDRLRRHVAQRQLQTTRQHGDRDFLRVGRGQYEDHMPRRFFEYLEHCIKCVIAEHVNFVDHIHLPAPKRWRIDGVFKQLGHFLNAPVASRIKLQIVHIAAAIDLKTGRAKAAWIWIIPVDLFTVQSLRKYSRNGCFPHPAGTRKQVSMVNPPGFQTMTQGLHHMLLPNERSKITWSPFTGQYLVL